MISLSEEDDFQAHFNQSKGSFLQVGDSYKEFSHSGLGHLAAAHAK